MKVLLFGANGMLGSALARHLEQIGDSVCRADGDITRLADIRRSFQWGPDAAINCVGIVKSECSHADAERVTAVNARAPHVLAAVACEHGARFVHISTDCVFDGKRGSYRETDPTDAEDLYGQSKAAGEVTDRSDCLTLRTSFIGRDPRRHRGLLEWLLRQSGDVPGFTHALWSGLSAPELSRAIALALATPALSGLYHVVGAPVSKVDLLEVLVRELKLACRVERVTGETIDRTLDGSKFATATGYSAPGWDTMAQELAVHA